jgi:dTDP-D-glucose 4,6-dehydratase
MDKPVETWFNVDRGGGDDVRRSNVDKIRATGWTHEVDLATGLRDTVAWYKRHIKEEWE